MGKSKHPKISNQRQNYYHVSDTLREYDVKSVSTDIVIDDVIFDMLHLSLNKDPIAVEEWFYNIRSRLINHVSKHIEKAKRSKIKTKNIEKSITEVAIFAKVPRTKTFVKVEIRHRESDLKDIVYVRHNVRKHLTLSARDIENNIIERQLLR